jgi:hypothetical protein
MRRAYVHARLIAILLCFVLLAQVATAKVATKPVVVVAASVKAGVAAVVFKVAALIGGVVNPRMVRLQFVSAAQFAERTAGFVELVRSEPTASELALLVAMNRPSSSAAVIARATKHCMYLPTTRQLLVSADWKVGDKDDEAALVMQSGAALLGASLAWPARATTDDARQARLALLDGAAIVVLTEWLAFAHGDPSPWTSPAWMATFEATLNKAHPGLSIQSLGAWAVAQRRRHASWLTVARWMAIQWRAPNTSALMHIADDLSEGGAPMYPVTARKALPSVGAYHASEAQLGELSLVRACVAAGFDIASCKPAFRGVSGAALTRYQLDAAATVPDFAALRLWFASEADAVEAEQALSQMLANAVGEPANGVWRWKVGSSVTTLQRKASIVYAVLGVPTASESTIRQLVVDGKQAQK